MGGLMKLHRHNGVGSNGNGSRGKQLMIMLAFGAAIIGAMALHKVRERRVIDLLVQEKHNQLSSLQLLLQKERDHAREVKRKLEEMKTKLHYLRAQNRGLDNRILEMQSTISSLREERRTLEGGLDEKQNQIKLMRERYAGASYDNPRVQALSKMLRQKESEMKDLRRRLQKRAKVLSVSTDDPLSANVHLHTATNVTETDDTQATRVTESNAGLQETANREGERNATELAENGSELAGFRNEQGATQGKDKTKDGDEIVDSGEKITEQTEKVDSKEIVSEQGNGNLLGRNGVEEHNSDESHTGADSGIQEEKNSTQIHSVEDHNNEGSMSRDEIHKGYSTKNKILQTTEDDLQGRNSNFQVAENNDSELKYKGGLKSELSNQPLSARKKQDLGGYLRKTKRKKLNKVLGSRENIENSENNSTVPTINTTYTGAANKSEMDKGGYQGTLHEIGNHYKSLRLENDSGLENHERKTADELSKDGLPGQDIRELEVEHGEEQKENRKEIETSIEESKAIPQGSELLRHDEAAQELIKDKKATIELQVEKREILNTTSISTGLGSLVPEGHANK